MSKKNSRDELLKTLQGITGSMREEDVEPVQVPVQVHEPVPVQVPVKPIFNHQFHFLGTKEQLKLVNALAKKWKVSQADVLRFLIDRAEDHL